MIFVQIDPCVHARLVDAVGSCRSRSTELSHRELLSCPSVFLYL